LIRFQLIATVAHWTLYDCGEVVPRLTDAES
jgi:hypothetical protein